MTTAQRYTRLALAAIFAVGCFAAGLATGNTSLYALAISGVIVSAFILAHN
jgi:hypothetical protein